MLIIKNGDIKSILAEKKKIIIYGAGNNFTTILEKYERTEFAHLIEILIDKNKVGQTYVYNDKEWLISSADNLQGDVFRDEYILLITIKSYQELLKQLNKMRSFHGMVCYLWSGFLNVHTECICTKELEIVKKANYQIPKVIHCCWFGGKPMGEKEKRCLKSWKRSNPDFDIQVWTENDFDTKINQYVQEAYESRKYGFVADFARYDILSKYGGFYFDVDVELLSNIGDLCESRGFISFESLKLINSGSGIAAMPGEPLILELRENYRKLKFANDDGSFNLIPCSERETALFRKYGIEDDDTYQIFDDFMVFPHEVFAPVNQYSGALELSTNTRGIHHFECSWFEQEHKEEWEERKNMVLEVNEQMLSHWKKTKFRG